MQEINCRNFTIRNNNPLLIVTAGSTESVPNNTVVYPSTYWSGPRKGRGNVSTSTITDTSKTITYSAPSRMDLNHTGLYYYSIIIKEAYGGGGGGSSNLNDLNRYIVVESSIGEINQDSPTGNVMRCDGLIYITSTPCYIQFRHVQITGGAVNLLPESTCHFIVTLLS